MKKAALVVALFVLLAGLGFAAWRMGYLPGAGAPASAGASVAAPASVPGGASGQATPAGSPGGAEVHSQESAAAPDTSLPPFDGNIAAHEWGGRMERITGAQEQDEWTVSSVLRGHSYGTGVLGPGPKDFVISFFGREPALIDRVEIVRALPSPPNEVEIWTSMSEPAASFTRVAVAKLSDLDKDVVRFDPVEARFVMVRMLKNAAGDDESFDLEWIKVFEATRPGYTPLLARRRDITSPVPASGAAGSPATPVGAMSACQPEPPALPPPGRAESRKALILRDGSGEAREAYAGLWLKAESSAEARAAQSPDVAIFDRVDMRLMNADLARPYHLSAEYGFDTVVLEQACSPSAPMAESFKKSLPGWVAAGHKLIIHDADKCAPPPDYGWLPYRLKTDNPGARGAEGGELRILEDNWMLHNRRGQPGFVDVAAWVASADFYRNELGDSNTFVEWDPRWCGQIVVRNVNDVFGFAGAYAHYGRGLIIYNGFDVDMIGTKGYDILVAREMAQGFDPDNLPCSMQVGSFVLATEPALARRALVPGRTLAYPLTLLSNQQYKGEVTLSVSTSPAIQGLVARFEPEKVAVSAVHQSGLTLTFPPNLAHKAVALEVKGSDSAGRTNTLCLQLGPPTGGELSVVSALAPPSKTRKNVEIILDASGSMKTLMGKRSRWDTALATLQEVLNKLPDDFNVGLRMYGHREASTSPKTCTDSELVVPIEPLDRGAIMSRARSFKPKGETPLVYSALQAPADLKALGGGTVIVITDGGESCKGDPVKAAAEMKASGLDIRLNIVGFAVTDPAVQKVLTGFAQAGGGRFYAAQSGQALTDALLIAAVEKFPYAVFDMAGKQIAAGDAGGPPDELPPGEYKVVVRAGAKEIVAPRVKVTLGQQTTVKIVLKGDQLALE